jgi:NADP-dependent 3-hydroxy acid dehydrogenase YdfG
MSSARTIFITGAGTGIGAATARLFACAGWRVAGSALHAEHLATVQADLGERFVPFVTDVRDRRGMCDAVADFAGRHGAGKLDAVFANAGVLWMGPDERLTPEQKQALIDVNASGLVHTFDAALPFLRRAAPGAHAVAMASTSAEYGSPHHALYSATKFFVRGYTEALAIEHRRSGIQVSGIYVSYVNTGMVTGADLRAPDRALTRKVVNGAVRSVRKPTDRRGVGARLSGPCRTPRKEPRPCSGRSS